MMHAYTQCILPIDGGRHSVSLARAMSASETTARVSPLRWIANQPYLLLSITAACWAGNAVVGKLAAALEAKAAKMMQPSDAERITGYHVGGISPFGQKKKVPVAFDQAALTHTTVFVNGGQRGLQIEIDPNDAALAAGARTHALTA